jgi:short-subunit dehydrogenase
VKQEVVTMRDKQESVIVITGASSGIGVATAYEFARRGASLVLAARREPRLQEIAEGCRKMGAQVLVGPVDVTHEPVVQNLARLAVESFGRLDVWINNAAVSLFGRFEETPIQDFKRVIETNLFGYVHGARAALPHFRQQGSGVLINVASIVGKVAQPYTSAYVMSKHAVRALGMSLRQELADARDIHVCTVMPASIDTPIFQHAANYMGRAIKPISPVYSAESVAKAIFRLTVHPRREVFVGGSSRILNFLNTVLPGVTERLMRFSVDRGHFKKEIQEATPGNLYKPMPLGYGISGGWKQSQTIPVGAIAAGSVVAAVSAAAILSRRGRGRRTASNSAENTK